MTASRYKADVLIVGGGISGAIAAIRAREFGRDVLLADKATFGRSGCTAVSSGVFAGYMPGDEMDVWLSTWGGGPLVNRRLTEKAALQAHELILMMDRWGVKWVKEEGKFYREASGGTGTNLKLNCLMEEGSPQFLLAIRDHAVNIGVRVLNRTMITDLLTSDGRQPTEGAVIGAVGFDKRTGIPCIVEAKTTIVCAGPYNFPYPSCSETGLHGMPIDLSADGQAMMLRAGAVLGKLESGGLSPSQRDSFGAPGLELLGGYGCRFVDENGRDILSSGSRDSELGMWGRRSAISHVITRRVQNNQPVFLDIRHLSPEHFERCEKIIPIVMETFRMSGYQPERDLIPFVCFHPATSGLSGGGAVVNEHGQTTLPGLYAAGNSSDAAYLAMGQQLPGAAVSGWWAGEHAALNLPQNHISANFVQAERLLEQALAPLQRERGERFETVHREVEIELENLSCILNQSLLAGARERIKSIRQRQIPNIHAPDHHTLPKVHALSNFCDVAEAVFAIMEHRAESRGNILRSDFPYTDNDRWLCYTRIRREAEGKLTIWDDARPDTDEYAAVPRTRALHPYFAQAHA